VLQEGSEMDADSRTSSSQVSPNVMDVTLIYFVLSHVSPVQACTFSSSVPSSPLRGGAVVCGRRPPSAAAQVQCRCASLCLLHVENSKITFKSASCMLRVAR
jgi:hypothetical protein